MSNVATLVHHERMRAGRATPRLAPTEKELADYIGDMLRSLGTCARHPDFKALHALIGAAEAEARALAE